MSKSAHGSKTAFAGERQKFWFEFITTPTVDTPASTLLLHFDDRRYLLGRIGEGLQRACIEQGIGLKKIRNLFVTGQTSWSSMGGMIGLILTMSDVQADERDPQTGKRPGLTIHGGPKLNHAMACARRFVFRTGMPTSISEPNLHRPRPIQEPRYEDDSIKVWALAVQKQGTGNQSPVPRDGRSRSPATVDREQNFRQKTVVDMFDSDWRKDRLFEYRLADVKLPALIWIRDSETKELKQIRCTSMADAPDLTPDSLVQVRHPWPAAMVEDLPPADNFSGSVAMSYVIRGQPQRGKFLPLKAKELGIDPGPQYARLSAGHSITLSDGREITPEMVLEPTDPGQGMAILDVPAEAYLDDLLEKISELGEHGVMTGVGIMTWLLGPGVTQSAKFRQTLEMLSQFEHVLSPTETSSNHVAFQSSAASAVRLSRIYPECFPVPIYTKDANDFTLQNFEGVSVRMARKGLRIHFGKTPQFETSEITPPFDPVSAHDLYKKDLKPLLPSSVTKKGSSPYDDIEIITLGTGSAVPSKYRNVSATLVRIPRLGNYLFDCGENTLGQLRRIYPAQELDEILGDLRLIWISHLHADHHLGTLPIILARDEATRKIERSSPAHSLYVISEANFADYLREYRSVQAIRNCEMLSILDSELRVQGKAMSIHDTTLPIEALKTARVSHCHGAQAVAVTFANGFKFSYSGDCRPSSRFAEIGRDSNVLLHEATFDDGMEGDAMAKKHSTTGEALAVAAAMRAQNVVLTHFSQRYQKIPVLRNIEFTEKIKFEEGDDAEADVEDAPNNASAIAYEEDQPEEVVQTKSTTSQNSALMQAAAKMNVCVAFDYMRVKVGQISTMHHYYPAIERMLELEADRSQQRRATAAAAQQELLAKKKPHKALKEKKKQQERQQTTGLTDVYSKINRNKSTTKLNKGTNGVGATTGQQEEGETTTKAKDHHHSNSNSNSQKPKRQASPSPPSRSSQQQETDKNPDQTHKTKHQRLA